MVAAVIVGIVAYTHYNKGTVFVCGDGRHVTSSAECVTAIQQPGVTSSNNQPSTAPTPVPQAQPVQQQQPTPVPQQVQQTAPTPVPQAFSTSKTVQAGDTTGVVVDLPGPGRYLIAVSGSYATGTDTR